MTLLAGIAGTSYGLLRARHATDAERLSKSEAQKRQTEAEAQRDRAEQREQVAIDAVSRFGDAVAQNQDLKDSPQLKFLRETLLKEPLAFLQSLRDRLQADSDTGHESLVRLADVAFKFGNLTNELGDKKDALRAHEQSRAIRDWLVKENPTVTQFRRDLALSHDHVGNLLRDTGKSIEALAFHEQGVAIQVCLVRENPTIIEFHGDLARSRCNNRAASTSCTSVSGIGPCGGIGPLFDYKTRRGKHAAVRRDCRSISRQTVRSGSRTNKVSGSGTSGSVIDRVRAGAIFQFEKSR